MAIGAALVVDWAAMSGADVQAQTRNVAQGQEWGMFVGNVAGTGAPARLGQTGTKREPMDRQSQELRNISRPVSTIANCAKFIARHYLERLTSKS